MREAAGVQDAFNVVERFALESASVRGDESARKAARERYWLARDGVIESQRRWADAIMALSQAVAVEVGLRPEVDASSNEWLAANAAARLPGATERTKIISVFALDRRERAAASYREAVECRDVLNELVWEFCDVESEWTETDSAQEARSEALAAVECAVRGDYVGALRHAARAEAIEIDAFLGTDAEPATWWRLRSYCVDIVAIGAAAVAT
jgi:tetratricopeptide (TPR) repeat protein